MCIFALCLSLCVPVFFFVGQNTRMRCQRCKRKKCALKKWSKKMKCKNRPSKLCTVNSTKCCNSSSSSNNNYPFNINYYHCNNNININKGNNRDNHRDNNCGATATEGRRLLGTTMRLRLPLCHPHSNLSPALSPPYLLLHLLHLLHLLRRFLRR